MYKPFRKSRGFPLLICRNLLRIPKSLSLISNFHCSGKTLKSDSKLDFILREVEEIQSLKPSVERGGGGAAEEESSNQNGFLESYKVQVSHPWPEWVELMERLLKKGYFGGDRYPFDHDEMGTKDSNRIRTACLNFARDRFDIIRFFSRKDIQVVAGSGCPSIDRKVVNSGKRLRAHVGLDEGNVCSSCSLRGSCERAYVKALKDEGGRTVDVMRILLTYGLDPITGSVENKPCLNKRVKESVRKLLNEMVEFSFKELNSNHPKVTASKRLSSIPENFTQQEKGQISVPMKQGDWVCPKCNFINFAKNVKCLRCNGLFQERLRKFWEDRDHLPMKKGDWLCDKCNFLNFAKNTRCLQCKEKPPKRLLNPGEWECDSCNYINFKKNMVCLKCDWKRPKASNYPDTSSQPQHEERGFHQPCRMKFVRDEDETNGQPSIRRERQSRNEGADMGSSMEDDGSKDDGSLSPWNKCSEFEDFPIVGGKSALSQNPRNLEIWKNEMSKRSRSVSRDRESDDELSSASFQRRLEFIESTDDEEMDGWFGYENKIKTEKHKTVPCTIRE